MRRGTTPTHTFTLPLDSASYDDILVTYKQCGKIRVERHKDEMLCSGTEVSIHFTEKETLGFVAGHDVQLQVRAVTISGEVLSSDIIKLDVKEVLNDEILGGN